MNILQLSKSIYKYEFPAGSVLKDAVRINVWLVVKGTDVYIIDTGFAEMTEELVKYITALGTPKALFVTHGHRDHILGVHQLAHMFDIPAYAHPLEIEQIENAMAPYPTQEDKMSGMFTALTDEIAQEAGLQFFVTPGHSPGHTIFYHKEEQVLLVGDLFTTTDKQLLPPIVRFTPDMTESIDSGAILDEIKPELISSSHGEDLLYNEELYSQLAYFFRIE